MQVNAMMKRWLRVIVTLLAGWLLYSMTATVPLSMAFPLPDFMHFGTRLSALPESGYTEDRALRAELDKASVPAGTFDGLNLFASGNAGANAWYDANNHAYRIICHEDAGNTQVIDANGAPLRQDAAGKRYTIAMDADDPNASSYPTDFDGWLSLQIGEYEYLLGTDYAWPSIAGSNGAYSSVQDWMAVLGNPSKIYPEKVGALLEKQLRENITPRELAALLHLYYRGDLLGWYPREHTMILKNPDQNEIRVVQTDAGTWQTLENLPYSHILAISHMEIIGYDAQNDCIVLHRFTDGMTATLLTGLDGLKQLNFKLEDDAFVLGGLTDDHTAFIYNCTTGDTNEINLGSDFHAQSLIFGRNGFLVISPEPDGTFRWKRGAY